MLSLKSLCVRTFWLVMVMVSFSPVYGADDYLTIHRDDGTPAYIFGIPSCLPHCDKEDQNRLTANSVMEKETVKAIASAEKKVFFSQFTFSRQPIFEELIAAQKRGVQVRGVVDKGQLRVLGEYCRTERCRALPAPFDTEIYQRSSMSERLTIAMGEELFKRSSISEKLAILFFGLSDGSEVRFLGGNRLMHHKFLLLDDQRLLSGSGNWSSTAISVNLENIVFSFQSEVVLPFVCVANALWLDQPLQRDASTACQTFRIFFSPVNGQPVPVVREIIDSVQESANSIDIAMHHLVHPTIISELSKARQRGVRVRIIADDDLCMQKIDENLKALIRAGAEVRYIQTSCDLFQLAHNKYAVFDQRKIINGSGNWSLAGLERSYENFIASNEALAIGAFTQAFEMFWQIGVTRAECGCNPSDANCRERYCLGRQ